jgi:protein-disulfide isomerase
LATAVELQVVHVNAWTAGASDSFCAINESWNCDAVARSRWSVFLGVPVAVWGIFGYVQLAAVAFWGGFTRGSRAAVALFAGLAFFSLATSAVLGVISKTQIASICILCLATYGINLLLAVLAALELRRAGVRESLEDLQDWARVRSGVAWGALAVTLAAAAGLITLLPKYWSFEAAQVANTPKLPSNEPGKKPDDRGKQVDLASGVTEDGHPWIGAPEPKLTIVEFSDYQCPFCARSHLKLRSLVEAHPQALRLVHRHFPLDQACNPIIDKPFHKHACLYSGMAACAGEQGKFWAANDFLYAHGRDDEGVRPQRMAMELSLDAGKLLECLEKRAIGLIRADLEEGVKLKITGTPTFQVNGQIHVGEIPPEVLAPYQK